jgi:hypothetical protein
MVRLSHPECAMTSAEKELGTCNHPFTAVSPSRQIFFRRFSLTLDLLLQRHTDASCNPVDVVAGPSTSQVVPVPCPTPFSSLRGYQRIGDVFIGGFPGLALDTGEQFSEGERLVPAPARGKDLRDSRIPHTCAQSNSSSAASWSIVEEGMTRQDAYRLRAR